MLVTSRETKRWVVPKGWPIRGAKPHASAAREALEEAGVFGRIDADAIGTYYYDKRLKNGLDARCKVEVFPLEVKSQRKRWREKGERKARWFRLGRRPRPSRSRVCGGCCAISTTPRDGRSLLSVGPSLELLVGSPASRLEFERRGAHFAGRHRRPDLAQEAGRFDGELVGEHRG